MRTLVIAASVALAPLGIFGSACGDNTPEGLPTSWPAGWQNIYDRPADDATAIEMLDDEYGLAVIGQSIHRTTDGGRSWDEVYAQGEIRGGITIADREHASVVAAPDLLRTSDGGDTWQRSTFAFEPGLGNIAAVSATAGTHRNGPESSGWT